jgi:hypothetical protein
MASVEFSPDASLPSYFPPMKDLAINGSPVPLPDIQPTHTSESFTVLSLGSPVLFECAIFFKIYCSEKGRGNTTNWVPVRRKSALSVTFNFHENVSLAVFRQLITEKCNEDYKGVGQMIFDGTTNLPATITWDVYILNNKKFPKKNPHHIFDDLSFNQWVVEINTSKQTKGGVHIVMDIHARRLSMLARRIWLRRR